MQSQKGFSLLETIIAMAIIGILGVAIPGALSTASKVTMQSSEDTMAESLARSQVDSIQNQPYDKTHNPPVYTLIPNLPASYSIDAALASRLDPKGDGTANDDGLQQITVTVRHNNKIVYTLIDFKVNLNH
jgi:prepilin-type N-terminal cleavage/methylation domain-containing protein